MSYATKFKIILCFWCLFVAKKRGLIDVRVRLSFLGLHLVIALSISMPASAKYLRVVHGTALELAVHNQFGAEFGGFWLLSPQITQLRRLPEYYSPDEAPLVEFAIEAYLAAQIREFKF